MLSKNALTFFRYAYWILAVGAQIAVCYLLFKTGRGIAGVIWLPVGFLLILAFYTVYFPQGSSGSTWPPTNAIASCPDYLTLVGPAQCCDFVGLNSPILKKADPANPPGPRDEGYNFDPTGTVQEKAAKARQYGLSWEGVV